MSKKIANEITELVNKWSQVRAVYPLSWSDERFLSSEDISYKTYLADGGRNAHKVVEVTIKGTKNTLAFLSDGVLLETSIAKPTSPKAILEALNAIYTEVTSIESIVEGKAALRKEIAQAKRDIKAKQRKIKEMEAEL